MPKPIKTYPIHDFIPREDFTRLGGTVKSKANIRAVYAREKRRPKKGEWYLTGAIVEAYRAPNDLPTVFHIARLVRVETVVVKKIVS